MHIRLHIVFHAIIHIIAHYTPTAVSREPMQEAVADALLFLAEHPGGS